MNRILMFVLFFVVFVGVYFGMNYYVFYKLSKLFDLNRNILFYMIVILSTFIYPIGNLITKNFYNIVTRGFGAVFGTFMGVMFLLFFGFLLLELLRFIPGIDMQKTGFIMVGIIAILTLYSVINSFSLVTNEMDIPISNLKEDVRFVQLSDIHTGSVRNSEYLKRIVEKTNSLDPDFVVITGDLVDGSAKLRDDMFEELDNLKAPAYFIIGNHETYEGVDKVMKVIGNTSVKTLRNEKTTIKGIELVGVDYSESKDNLKNALEGIKLNSSKPSILLYHAPSEIDAAKDKGFDLMLSGHTHNGQIFPFNLFVRLQFKYSVGLHDVGDMNIYISPGTGMWGPPMRLGSKNEITLFNLKKQ